jgi:hypothetical protein
MEPKYFYVLDGSIEGPEPMDKLADLHARHVIDGDTWVFAKGGSQWLRYARLLADDEASPSIAQLPPIPLEIPPFWKNAHAWAVPLRIGIYVLVLAVCGGLVYASIVRPWAWLDQVSADRLWWSRAVFGLYALTLISLWAVYFRSTAADGTAALPTLRGLLRAYSTQWTRLDRNGNTPDTEKNYDPQLVKALQEKARVTLTSMAMLAAAAGVELAQANAVLMSAMKLDEFRLLVLAAGSLSAFTSLVCFLLATDTLDSVCNSFALPRLKQRVLRHFYQESLNPRYFGLVCLMFGAVCLIAIHEPLFGAAAAGLIIAIGYRHWFPPTGLGSDKPFQGAGSQMATGGFFVRAFVGVLVPLWLLAYGHLHPLVPC